MLQARMGIENQNEFSAIYLDLMQHGGKSVSAVKPDIGDIGDLMRKHFSGFSIRLTYKSINEYV